jgi:hypothetical protein
MNARKAVAVGEMIVRVGKGESGLPPAVVSALTQVEERHKGLADEVASWVEPSGADASMKRAMDIQVDAAWSAFHTWLRGWTRIPTNLAADQGTAEKTFNDLFEEGLKFTRLAWQQEWTESSARLQRIVDKGHEAVITQLGGDQFLTALRAAHQAYGEALGITAEQPEPEPVPQIRKSLEAFRKSLRTYVLRVAAMADEKDAASQALVTKLLAPLRS